MKNEIEPHKFNKDQKAGFNGKNGAALKKALATVLEASLLSACLNSPISASHAPSLDKIDTQSSFSGEVLLPEAYASVKEAYAAIQGSIQGEQGKCMTYFNYNGDTINAWVETVFDYLKDHPEIHYISGTGGWGGPTERYDQKGYCLIMALPIDGDSAANSGVLLYEAFGQYGPETKYVRFNGTYNNPIFPSSEE